MGNFNPDAFGSVFSQASERTAVDFKNIGTPGRVHSLGDDTPDEEAPLTAKLEPLSASTHWRTPYETREITPAKPLASPLTRKKRADPFAEMVSAGVARTGVGVRSLYQTLPDDQRVEFTVDEFVQRCINPLQAELRTPEFMQMVKDAYGKLPEKFDMGDGPTTPIRHGRLNGVDFVPINDVASATQPAAVRPVDPIPAAPVTHAPYHRIAPKPAAVEVAAPAPARQAVATTSSFVATAEKPTCAKPSLTRLSHKLFCGLVEIERRRTGVSPMDMYDELEDKLSGRFLRTEIMESCSAQGRQNWVPGEMASAVFGIYARHPDVFPPIAPPAPAPAPVAQQETVAAAPAPDTPAVPMPTTHPRLKIVEGRVEKKDFSDLVVAERERTGISHMRLYDQLPEEMRARYNQSKLSNSACPATLLRWVPADLAVAIVDLFAKTPDKGAAPEKAKGAPGVNL